jgi:DNA repair protein RecO (recombination protein O)
LEAPGLLAAYVLHTRRYRDSSLIVELLTREQGRLSCVARGALRARRGGVRPQAFVPLLVGLRGRGEMQSLASAESSGRPLSLAGSRLFCGLYLNELVLYLTIRHDPCEGLFDDYQHTLFELQAAATPEPVLRRFEVGLLRHLGHGLMLDTDSRGQPICPDTRYTYDFEAGPVVTMVDSADALSGATLQSLERGEFSDAGTLREARLFMRRVLNHYLEGRPLRSRELFR